MAIGINYVNAGTASVTAGDTTVTFAGASLSMVKAGDLFLQKGASGVIASVDEDAGTAELVSDWGGATTSAQPYIVLIIPQASELAESTRKLQTQLSAAVLGSFVDLEPSPGETPVWNEDGSAWDLISANAIVESSAPEDTVASAATTDIGGAAAQRVQVTGTTAITSFGTKANTLRIVRFAGVLTLTHNVTSLILLGGASRSTAAGDIGIYASDTIGNWRELAYARASVPPLNLDTDATFAANSDANVPSQKAVKTALKPFSGRNCINNGNFRVNQRGYTSGGTLASGKYGHDRFKAGSAGGDYSFTQNASDTTITIATGKTLIQVVEDKNVEGGNYVLSWSGTAQARVGTGGSAPSGSYAASPVMLTGVTAGQTMSVEFNAGTLGKVQLEPGSIVTPFEPVNYALSLDMCRRYCRVIGGTALKYQMFGQALSSTRAIFQMDASGMRATPSLFLNGSSTHYLASSGAGSGQVVSSVVVFSGASKDLAMVDVTTSGGLTAGQSSFLFTDTGFADQLWFEAEL